MYKILFTGGGTAGHVTPNLALIDELARDTWDIHYAGNAGSIEEQLISTTGLPFHRICSGKLRRQLTWRNLLTPFQVLRGVWQAYRLCRSLRPDVVFSKGGFVAFPIVIGAWLNHIPVIAHESDLTPGLANRLSYPFVKRICLTFAHAQKNFRQHAKLVVTGSPLRNSLFSGNADKGRALCNFTGDKPILLAYGGSQGSAIINHQIRAILPHLLEQFQVIHICGKGKLSTKHEHLNGYRQFDYVNTELPHLYACSDLVISRAGANSIYELLSLRLPSILIPLSRQISRGDQIANAEYFAEQGACRMLEEESLTPETLLQCINNTFAQHPAIVSCIQQLSLPNANEAIIQLLKKYCADKNALPQSN